MKKYLICTTIFFMSCSYDFPFEENQVSSGNVSVFENIVLVGGTMSADVMDGAISSDAQQFNYMSILVNHLNKESSVDISYNHPNIISNTGYNIFDPQSSLTGSYKLAFSSAGTSDRPFDRNEVLPNLKLTEGEDLHANDIIKLNTLAVPYFRSDQLKDFSKNNFYNKLSLDQTSMSDLVLKMDPSMLVIDVGFDDILPLAINGGTTEITDTPDNDDALSIEIFEENLGIFLNKTASDFKGPIIIFSIPDFTKFPYFTQVPYNIYISPRETQVIGSNFQDFNYNILLWNYSMGNPDSVRRPIVDFDYLAQAYNGYLIFDNDLSDAVVDGNVLPKVRQLKEGESILWPDYERLKPLGYGVVQPVDDINSLTYLELNKIRDLIQQYNGVIYRAADVYDNVYVFDFFKLYEDLLSNIDINEGVWSTGDKIDNSLMPYGIFSADGITLNPRGNALLANELIKKIGEIMDQDYGKIDLSTYSGNSYENNF